MLDEGVAFARRARAQGRRLLVHCHHGIGRSATLALCVLVDRGLSPLDALSQAKDDARREQIYQRMALTVTALSGWLVLPLSCAALGQHAILIRQRLNVGSNDLKIAASALEHNATVVTRNLRDFGRVPGLPCQDWTI